MVYSGEWGNLTPPQQRSTPLFVPCPTPSPSFQESVPPVLQGAPLSGGYVILFLLKNGLHFHHFDAPEHTKEIISSLDWTKTQVCVFCETISRSPVCTSEHLFRDDVCRWTWRTNSNTPNQLARTPKSVKVNPMFAEDDGGITGCNGVWQLSM